MLYRILVDRFGMGDLREICHRLGIDNDELSQDTKRALCMDLIGYCNRRNRCQELIDVCRASRPRMLWEDSFEDCSVPSIPSDMPDPELINFNLTYIDLSDISIQDRLFNHRYFQVCGTGGSGKTTLLHNLRQTLDVNVYSSVWIDFSSEHRNLRADVYAFLKTILAQITDDLVPDFISPNISQLIQQIGRLIASMNSIVLLLDNFDLCTPQFVKWLCDDFLREINQWQPFRIIVSAKASIKEIAECNNINFQKVVLAPYMDRDALERVIKRIASQYDVRHILNMQNGVLDLWTEYVDEMVTEILGFTYGHPLAIERILDYAYQEDRLRHPRFFHENQHDIAQHCLRPVIDGRILYSIGDAEVREEFRTLCIFRYIWPMLLQARQLRQPAAFQIAHPGRRRPADPRKQSPPDHCRQLPVGRICIPGRIWEKIELLYLV